MSSQYLYPHHVPINWINNIPTDWKLECLFGKFRPHVQNWKIAFLPAFQKLECLPPPRMKLFGNQQLECLQGHMFFSRQKRIYIYILDPPSHHKKGSLPHNFHSFSNFSGYLEVLGIWMYLFENITLCFVHFAGLGKDSMKSFNEPTGSRKALLLAFPIR